MNSFVFNSKDHPNLPKLIKTDVEDTWNVLGGLMLFIDRNIKNHRARFKFQEKYKAVRHADYDDLQIRVNQKRSFMMSMNLENFEIKSSLDGYEFFQKNGDCMFVVKSSTAPSAVRLIKQLINEYNLDPRIFPEEKFYLSVANSILKDKDNLYFTELCYFVSFEHVIRTFVTNIKPEFLGKKFSLDNIMIPELSKILKLDREKTDLLKKGNQIYNNAKHSDRSISYEDRIIFINAYNILKENQLCEG